MSIFIKILRVVKNFFIDLTYALVPITLFTLFFFISYRYETYQLIQSIYPSFEPFSFSQYIGLSLYNDSTTLYVTLVILLHVFLVLNKIQKGLIYISSGILIAMAIMHLAFIDFFKVYESTYHFNFIGKENLTGWQELLHAAIMETTLSFYIKLIIIIPIIIGTLYFWNKKRNLLIILKSDSKLVSGLIFSLSVPVLLIVLTIISLNAGNPETKALKIARNFKMISTQKAKTTLIELSMNPLRNLFIIEDKTHANIIDIAEDYSDIEEGQSLRLDTTSLESKKTYPRLNIIPRGKKYNIIFYFFESTASNYLDLKINNQYVTPTWRRLHKNSFVATNHFANFPLSINAMISTYASAYGHVSRIVSIAYPHIKLKFMSEILKEQGYATFLIHTGKLSFVNTKGLYKTRKFDKILEMRDLKRITKYKNEFGWGGVDERAMIEPSVKFMKEHIDKPFFVSYFPLNPHHPYPIPEKKFQITGEIPKNIKKRKKRWMDYMNSLYYGDVVLGMIIDRLEKEGLMENTLLFLFADHGQAFYQHKSNYSHPFFLYEENIHVPFMIYNKKLFKKTVYFNGITRHIDILPTVQDILGIKGNKEQEGISILGQRKEQMVLLQKLAKNDMMGIRDVRWKYIIRMDNMFEELYDLKNDPMEQENLAFIKKDITKKYRKFLFKARKHKTYYYNTILKKGYNKIR